MRFAQTASAPMVVRYYQSVVLLSPNYGCSSGKEKKTASNARKLRGEY